MKPYVVLVSIAVIFALVLVLAWGREPVAPIGHEPVNEPRQAAIPARAIAERKELDTTVERVLVADLKGERHSFEIRCTDSDGGLPLPGVRAKMLSLTGGRDHLGVTSSDGRLKLSDLPSGKYYVGLSHDSYLLQSSTIDFGGMVTIPGDPATTKWARAYAYGVRLGGGLVDARFDTARPTGFERVSTRMTPEYQELSSHLNSIYAAADNEYVKIVCIRNIVSSPTIKVIGWHPLKGPCEFEISISPVDAFGGITNLDPSNLPVVEAMAEVRCRVMDPAGKKVDVGSFTLRRSNKTNKTNMFLHGSCDSNGRCFVPAGDYKLSASSWPVETDIDERAIRLIPGEDLTVDFILKNTYENVHVRILSGGTQITRGAVANIVTRFREYPKGAMGGRYTMQGECSMSLPRGRVDFILLYWKMGASKAEETTVSVIVDRPNQMIQIDL